MIGELIAAGITPRVAIEAVRLLSRVVDGIDVVAHDGREYLLAFRAGPELHDALCAWNADAEDGEDDGTREEDHRAYDRSTDPVRSNPVEPDPAFSPPVPSQGPADEVLTPA